MIVVTVVMVMMEVVIVVMMKILQLLSFISSAQHSGLPAILLPSWPLCPGPLLFVFSLVGMLSAQILARLLLTPFNLSTNGTFWWGLPWILYIVSCPSLLTAFKLMLLHSTHHLLTYMCLYTHAHIYTHMCISLTCIPAWASMGMQI